MYPKKQESSASIVAAEALLDSVVIHKLPQSKKAFKKAGKPMQEGKVLQTFKNGWKIIELSCEDGKRTCNKWQSPGGKRHPSEKVAKAFGFKNK